MKNKFAIFILRVSLGLVFLIFGIGKFQNDLWAQTIKSMEIFQNLPWSPDVSIFIIVILEVVTAILLILGLLNFQEIRDIGLIGSAVCLLIIKNKAWGLDWLIEQKKRGKNGTQNNS